jgi:hypothetical protein
MVRPGDHAAYQRMTSLADEYRSDGNLLCAGLAYERACHAAWGDPPRMQPAIASAMECYLQVSKDQDHCSDESLAALVKAIKVTWQSYLWRDREEELRRLTPVLSDDLAQRLVSCFAESDNAESYLVRGASLRIGADGAVTSEFTTYEVDMGAEQGSPPDGWTVFLPSAFRLFLEQADYTVARQIAEKHADAFTTPALRGWRAAVLGFTNPDDAVRCFRDASAEFAQDLAETLPRPDGATFWSGINSQLWAPYFAARASVAEIRSSPQRVTELISAAVASCPFRDIGWGHAGATAFAVLIASLNELLTTGDSSGVRRIQSEFASRFAGLDRTPDAELVERFITLAANSFEGFRTDPVGELASGRLRDALELLKKIPLLDSGIAEAVTPALSKQAFTELLGGQRTWIYRTLESIKDERTLQKIILRLLQSALPTYAQILHGPLEYGKDIVAAFQSDDDVVLRMYQLKAGDITTSNWDDAKSELEKMFLVPLSDFQLPAQPTRTEGVLLCNGHCNPYVEPVVKGWFAEQQRVHGWVMSFKHLDHLVSGISANRLISELRSALHECGVAIVWA